MAAATPPPTSVRPPGPAPSPPAPPPRQGTLDDTGVVRRDSVHALAWRVRGASKVLHEVDAGTVRIQGSATVGGPLTADELVAEGSLDAGDRVEVRGTLRADVSFETLGPVRAGELDVRGMARFGGAVTVARSASTSGTFEAPSLTAAVVVLRGGVAVAGELVAGSVDARLSHDSTLGSVRARTVTLRGKVPNLVEKVLQHTTTVTVDRIEAETVTLEAVDVEYVRAPAIVLGRDCHVTTVEGTIVRRHPTSDVGPRSKSPAPYGMRR